MAFSDLYSVLVSPEAETDIKSIVADLIEHRSMLVLNAWLDELDQIKLRLAKNPYSYRSYFLFAHRVNFRKHPYFVAYAIDSINLEVEVIMVAHQQQDPDKLARRLNL